MKSLSDEPPMPKITQESNGIRVFVGNQTYLLRIPREAFEEAFRVGVRCLQLADTSASDTAFSRTELDEVRQQIVTEAIRFLAINQLPLRINKEAFFRPRIIRAVFEKAEAKFSGRRDAAYLLTAKTVGGTAEEVRQVVGNFDARAEI